jgi:hypothetical protein
MTTTSLAVGKGLGCDLHRPMDGCRLRKPAEREKAPEAQNGHLRRSGVDRELG